MMYDMEYHDIKSAMRIQPFKQGILYELNVKKKNLGNEHNAATE